MKNIIFNNKIYSRKIPLRGIYKITCTASKKCYIGSSINIVRRFQTHIQELKGNRHINPILQNTYHKYGSESFIYEVVAEAATQNYEELLILEKHYLETLRPELNISKETLSPPRIITKVQKYSHDGVFIKQYESVVSAAEELNIEPTNIFAVLRGVKPQAAGFLWTSVDSPPDTIPALCRDLSGTNAVSDFWKNGKYTITKKDISNGATLEIYTKLEDLLIDLKTTRQNVMSQLKGRTKTCCGFALECPEFTYIRSFSAGVPKQTLKLSEDRTEIERFPSASAAARAVGLDKSAILNAIKGNFRSAGFFWEYS